MIKTGSWFSRYPDDHIIIGISRGIPRKPPPSYKMYRKLQPGSWFNQVGEAEYRARYQVEVLDRLNPQEVAREIAALADGKVPVLVCFEHANGPGWCHRALAAEWLAEGLGEPVREHGFELLAQDQHPLLPPSRRRR